MIDFKNKFNNNLKLFENIQKKLNKKKKVISFLKFFKSFFITFDTKNRVKEFFVDFFFCSTFFIITILTFNIFFLVPEKPPLIIILIGTLCFLFTLFFSIISFKQLISKTLNLFFITNFFNNNFSKKETTLIQKFKTTNVIDMTNIFIFTLDNLEIKKDHFNDIVSVFNQNKDLVNKNDLFLVIKNNFIKQYKKSKISAGEFKYSINFFINSFNIKDQDLIKKTYLEIENLTFDEKDENQNSIFNFQTNKKESIIF
tara:strand:- start:6291 stop:7058 length:768 start_codon:yes stop_codon:yes gene_type:complete